MSGEPSFLSRSADATGSPAGAGVTRTDVVADASYELLHSHALTNVNKCPHIKYLTLCHSTVESLHGIAALKDLWYLGECTDVQSQAQYRHPCARSHPFASNLTRWQSNHFCVDRVCTFSFRRLCRHFVHQGVRPYASHANETHSSWIARRSRTKSDTRAHASESDTHPATASEGRSSGT
jgi:hypothetical protein